MSSYWFLVFTTHHPRTPAVAIKDDGGTVDEPLRISAAIAVLTMNMKNNDTIWHHEQINRDYRHCWPTIINIYQPIIMMLIGGIHMTNMIKYISCGQMVTKAPRGWLSPELMAWSLFLLAAIPYMYIDRYWMPLSITICWNLVLVFISRGKHSQTILSLSHYGVPLPLTG